MDVFLARMVMPRSRSSGFESMTQSVVSWFDRKAPDCRSRKSTRVVFPWSTWAMIAMFLRSMSGRKYIRGPWGMQRGSRNPRLLVEIQLLQEEAEVLLDLELGRPVPFDRIQGVVQRRRDEQAVLAEVLPLHLEELQQH